MNLSINGQSQVPPGFRFHPTEEELLQYYLRKKVAYEKIDLDVIREVDLNKLEPWDIQEKCRIGSTPQNDWYFFSHKDKKYPTGTRTNRATAAGFWKATGRDKIIYSGFRRIGLRKTLVFYKGRAPHGQKSDWIMHEYRLDESTQEQPNVQASLTQSGTGDLVPEEGWVVCRVFKKKNYQKTLDSPKSLSTNSVDNKIQIVGSDTIHDGVLDQILSYMGRNCKDESGGASSLGVSLNKLNFPQLINSSHPAMYAPLNERFLHLPRLESPTINNDNHMNNNNQNCDSFKQFQEVFDEIETGTTETKEAHEEEEAGCGGGVGSVNDWVMLDRLVASQLNGQVETETSKQLSSCFNMSSVSVGGLTRDDDDEDNSNTQVQAQLSTHIRLIRPNHTLHNIFASNDNDLWSFTPNSSSSSSDPLRHLSV